MLNKIALMLLVLMGSGISGFSQKPAYYNDSLNSLYKQTVDLITADELKALIERDPKVVMLDTREVEEFEVSHIENARRVGYMNFEISMIDDISKKTPIVLYCSLGVRSELVGEKLKEAGYKNVKNLYGGIFEWVYQGYPVVNNSGNETGKVHAFDEEWSEWLLKGEKIY